MGQVRQGSGTPAFTVVSPDDGSCAEDQVTDLLAEFLTIRRVEKQRVEKGRVEKGTFKINDADQLRRLGLEATMRNEFTAIIERDDDWYIGYCPEIPGANGQGRTIEECRLSLADAIALILEDRREEGLRGVPADAVRETVTVG